MRLDRGVHRVLILVRHPTPFQKTLIIVSLDCNFCIFLLHFGAVILSFQPPNLSFINLFELCIRWSCYRLCEYQLRFISNLFYRFGR